MVATILERPDIARRADEAREWLAHDPRTREVARRSREAQRWLARDARAREVGRRGRDAQRWLMREKRGRVVRLVLVSVAVSIAMSLLATALAGFVKRRRGSAVDSTDVVPETVDVAGAEHPDETAGVPVMEGAMPAEPPGAAPVEA